MRHDKNRVIKINLDLVDDGIYDVVALKSHLAFQSALWLIRRFNRLKSQPFLEFKSLMLDAVVNPYPSLVLWHLFLITRNARNSN